MCGIFSLLNNTTELTMQFIEEQFQKGKHRGPEFSKISNVMIKAYFGFHRLAINGLNAASNQPIILNDIALICNGEIYNYKELYMRMALLNGEVFKPETQSDCEVIIHLYKRYGMEQTLNMLDGVFSFVLIDYRLNLPNAKIYVARDPHGVRPLYFLSQKTPPPDFEPLFGFASELKMLTEIKTTLNNQIAKTFMKKYKNSLTLLDLPSDSQYNIQQFEPGTYSTFDYSFKVSSSWKPGIMNRPYHMIGHYSNEYDADSLRLHIQHNLCTAVMKRCTTTERPVACLLSGGLDSSLITALVNEYYKNGKSVTNGPGPLETYSIGLAGSTDLKNARIVADYLGTNHTEIVLTEQDFLDAIPQVIYDIESYDTTTVRASIGNWLLGKYISEHSETKVIFNGDGADELAGGYLYMNYCPDVIEFDKESRRLLKDIHAFDVLRSDKSISSHGLEPRTPFLDRFWVQYYMSIPPAIRFHKYRGVGEKHLIRDAFSDFKNSKGEPLLPKEILWRKKEAFSDGVSKQSRSLYEIIQEHAEKIFVENDLPLCPFMQRTDEMYEHMAYFHYDMKRIDRHLIPKTAEQFYYRKIFETHYQGMGKIVPYFWMPKYVDAKDASARTLEIYEKTQIIDSEYADNLV
jgi:asparagine synthase (glutamine-hydrolysing)